jgi:hypothetical protein
MHPETLDETSLGDNEFSIKPAPPRKWPPRIPATQAPRWVRVRDLVLTLAVWLAYLWILREPIVAFIGWLSPRLGVLLSEVVRVEFTVDLWPFFWVAAALVAWLALFGVLRRQYLSRLAGAEHDVPVLPPEAHFEAAGVAVSQLPLWREARCLRVHYEDGRITSMTVTSLPPPE